MNNQFKILLVEFKEISERSYMFHCSKYLEEFQSSEINKIEFKNNDAKSICSEDLRYQDFLGISETKDNKSKNTIKKSSK